MKSWLCYHRSAEAKELQARHPNAFLLLCQIARRARLTPCPITGLQIGQAYIGDYRQAGIQTERQYRTAKNTLKKREFSTFKATSKGTIATLLEQGVFSLSPDEATDKPTGKRQASDRQPTSKIERYNDTKKKDSLCREADEILKSIWDQSPPMGRQWSSPEKLKSSWMEIPEAQRPTKEIVIHALNAWCASEAWQKDGGRWVQATHNWIKDRQWENIPTNQTTSPQLKKRRWE
jgi:hypothetical protein